MPRKAFKDAWEKPYGIEVLGPLAKGFDEGKQVRLCLQATEVEAGQKHLYFEEGPPPGHRAAEHLLQGMEARLSAYRVGRRHTQKQSLWRRSPRRMQGVHPQSRHS